MSQHVRLLGKVSTIAYNGNLIIKAKFTPKIFSEVLDGSTKALGKVIRIFGPVDEPYLSVKPSKKLLLNMMGQEVYTVQK